MIIKYANIHTWMFIYIYPRMKVLFLGRIISMNLDSSFFVLWIAIHEQVLWECLLLIYSKTPPAADPVDSMI